MTRKSGKRYRYRTNNQDLDGREEQADASQNIGDTQRLVSAIAGAGLVAEGWRRRSIIGGILAAAGVALLYRAARHVGHEPSGSAQRAFGRFAAVQGIVSSKT